MPAPASGQLKDGYTPLNARQYEQALVRLLPEHRLANDERFRITLRIAPSFSAESQVSIGYDLHSRCTVRVRTLVRRLTDVATPYLRRGGDGNDIDKITSLAGVETTELKVEADTGRRWLRGLWKAVADQAAETPATALKLDGTDELEVTLDGTTYELRYSDTLSSMMLRIGGPELDYGDKTEDLEPLVAWIVSVLREVEELRRQK